MVTKKIIGWLLVLISVVLLYPLYISLSGCWGCVGPFWNGVFVFGTLFVVFLLSGIYLIKSKNEVKK